MYYPGPMLTVPELRSSAAKRPLVCILLLGALAACGSPTTPPEPEPLPPTDTRLHPVHRLADPGYVAPPYLDEEAERRAARFGERAGFAIYSATIHDETRHTLPYVPLENVLARKDLPIPEGRRLVFDHELHPVYSPHIARSTLIVAQPEVRYGSAWEPLEDAVVSVVKQKGRAMVHLELPVPEDARVSLDVRIKAFGAQQAPIVHATEPLDVPPEAFLEFSVGILAPAWSEGPVRFRVEACREQDCETLHQEEVDPSLEEAQRWQDRRVELSRLSGQKRRFVFTTERVREDEGYTLAVWGNPTVLAPRPRRPEEFNVILLSLDTLRADRLGTYGYQHPTAPFIDQQVARRGVVFERCVTQAPTTTRSHMTMFTSLYPSTHQAEGVRILAPEIPTLAQYLRAAGIETGAVTENGWVAIQHGFGRGMNQYKEDRRFFDGAPGQIEATYEAARAWLRRHHDKQFFLFVHTYQVHNPFNPAEKYRELFTEQRGETVDDESPLHLRQSADYDREIRETDDALRGLFAELAELELTDRTIIVLTSDHGEEFLEHGQLGHGANLYEEVSWVPLMFVGPSVPAGRRVPTPVGLVDITPTVLDLYGLSVPEGIEGVSLAGSIRRDTALPSERPLYTESMAARAALEGGWVEAYPPYYTVRRGSLKLIRFGTEDGNRYELYDLDADPLEQHDLYADRTDAARELTALLDGYEEHCRERREDLLAGVEGEAPPPAALSEEQLEKLKGLGYIE